MARRPTAGRGKETKKQELAAPTVGQLLELLSKAYQFPGKDPIWSAAEAMAKSAMPPAGDSDPAREAILNYAKKPDTTNGGPRGGMATTLH